MAPTTAAIVGAAGGVGATRLTVELGATLARDGREVALLDAAFATQGLAGYVDGRIDADLTALLVERADGGTGRLESGAATVADGVPGRLVAWPAYAPFERLARAKTPAAAQALEGTLAELAGEFDHVLLDTPPVAANQAVAAVTAADRVALLTVPGDRGADALQRARGRLADLDAAPDIAVANRTDDHPDAAVAIPESRIEDAGDPACLGGPTPFAPAVASLAEALFETTLSVEFERGIGERLYRILDRDR